MTNSDHLGRVEIRESATGLPVEWLDADKGPLFYTNNVGVSASLFDITLQVGLTQEVKKEKIIARETAKIVMSPQHAKALATILSSVVEAYEMRVGPIPSGLSK